MLAFWAVMYYTGDTVNMVNITPHMDDLSGGTTFSWSEASIDDDFDAANNDEQY